MAALTLHFNILLGPYISVHNFDNELSAEAVAVDFLEFAEGLERLDVGTHGPLAHFGVQLVLVFTSHQWLLGRRFHLPQYHRFLHTHN